MLSRLRQAYIPLFTQITVPYILLALIIASGGTGYTAYLRFAGRTLRRDRALWPPGTLQAVLAEEVDPAGDKFGGIVATALGDYFFVSGPITDTEGNLAGVTLVGISVDSLAAQARLRPWLKSVSITGGQ